MKSIAAITILASSAAAFAPTPVSRVESSLSYAKELDSMFGTTVETGGRVVCIYYVLLCIVCYLNLFYYLLMIKFDTHSLHFAMHIFSSIPSTSATTSQLTGHAGPSSPMAVRQCLQPLGGSSPRCSGRSTPKT